MQRGNQEGITVANSAVAARQILELDENFLIANERTQEMAVSIAQQREKDGIKGATRFLMDILAEERSEKLQQERQTAVTPLLLKNSHTFATPLAQAVLKVAASGYVGLSPNVSVNGLYDESDVNKALQEWTDYGDDLSEHIKNVHTYQPQNKAEQGKGNVGNTLAKRKWQANIISTWFGRTINVHIDVDK